MCWVNWVTHDDAVCSGLSNVTSRDGSGTSASVGQYHLTNCMDFPYPICGGGGCFFLVNFRVTASLF